MGVPGSAAALLLGLAEEAPAQPYVVSNSLRLDSAATAQLKKRFSKSGNRRTWSFSCWVKLGQIENTQQILFSASSGSNGYLSCDLRDMSPRILAWNGGAVTYQLHTSLRLRDPSAWYHLLFTVDTTAAQSDRLKIFVNGVRQTSFITEAQPNLNEETYVNVADNTEDYPAFHYIGNNASYTYNAWYDGYIAEVRFVDGEAITPSEVTETDVTTGLLIPKDYTHGSAVTSGGFTLADNDFTWSGLRSGSANDPDDGALTDGGLNYGETFWGNNGANGAYLDINMAGASAGEVYSVRYWNAAEAGGQTITATCKQIDSSGNDISGTAYSQTWNQGQKWNTYIQTIASNCHRIRLIFSGNSNNSYGWGIGEVQVSFVPKHVNDFYLKFDPSVSGVTYTDGDNNTVDGNGVVNSFIVDAVGNTTFAYHSAEYGTDKIFGKGPQGIYTSYPSNSVSEYKIDLNALGSFGTISQIRLLIRYASGSQYSPWNVSILDANKSVIGGPHVVASGALSWQDFSYSGTPRYIKLDDGDGASSKRCILGGVEINGVVLIDHTSIGADSSGRSNDWYEENLVASAPTIQYGANTSNYSFDSSATSLTYNTTGFTYSTVSSPKTDSGNANASTVLKTADGTEATFVFSTDSTDRYIWTSSDGINWTSTGSYYDTDGSPQTITAAWVAWAGGSNASTLTITFAGTEDQDIVFDTPTDYDSSGTIGGNWAVFNPLTGSGTKSDGNLKTVTPNSYRPDISTITPTSGKWYGEITWVSGQYARIGVQDAGVSSNDFGEDIYGWRYENNSGNFYNGSNGTQSQGPTWGNGTTIGIALDCDSGKVWIAKNNVWIVSGNPATGANPSASNLPIGRPLAFACATGTNASTFRANFGQHGSFKYTPPSGFKAMCTTNMGEPPIIDGSKHFTTVTRNGGGVVQTLNFGADFVWEKRRNVDSSHYLFDSVRGKDKWLSSNNNNSQGSASPFLSFNSDGYTVNASYDWPASATIVDWAWNAGANSDKTYTVTVVNSGGNKYRFDGSPNNAVTLDLAEGSTYTFDQSHSSNTGHPIRFGTSANGTGYTTGVTHTGTPGSAGAKTTLVLASGAPTLYYSCQNHSGMGGQINTNDTAGATHLIGGQNSSTYDQSSTWSSNWSASGNGFGSHPPSHGFDANFNNNINNAQGGQVVTWDTTSYSLAGKLRINCYSSSGAYDVYVNGSKASDTPSSRGWIDCGTFADINEIQFAGSSYNSGSGLGSAGIIIYQFEVAGKLLIDSSVTPPDTPTVSSVVKANQDAGFSIVKWTNPNTICSISHGLNVEPHVIITKATGSSSDLWQTYHKDIGYSHKLYLSGTNGLVNSSVWDNAHPTGGTFKFNDNITSEWIAYCFANVEGFSQHGRIHGTGNNPGPYVATNFKPAFVMIKALYDYSGGSDIVANTSWIIYDSARGGPHNPNGAILAANQDEDEEDNSSAIDFLSNGFIIRNQRSINTTSDAIYLAFASNPFKYARGV